MRNFPYGGKISSEMKYSNMKGDSMSREKTYMIYDLIRSINREINRNVCSKIGFKNMNSSTISVLVRVMDEPKITLKELSSNVGLANSTVSGIVDNLVEKELLERVVDETDRRRILISPSQKALNIRKDIAQKYTDYIRNVLTNATDEDVSVILDGLLRFNQIIKGSEAA